MNIQAKIKILILLCVMPVSYAFTAQPAAAPDSLDAKFAAIDALSNLEILCTVDPLEQADAERLLAQGRNTLKEFSNIPLAQKQALLRRSVFKCNLVYYELESCNDAARRNNLLDEYNRLSDQYNVAQKEQREYTYSCVVNGTVPASMYDFMVHKSNAMLDQARLLLAKNEKLEQEKMQLQERERQSQQEKIELQEREQALLVQLRGYQLLEDGQQIEGVPNVPGGPKKEHKRRGSF